MKRKVTLTFCGHEVATVIISYTEAHENVALITTDEKRDYELRTGKCSERAHVDSRTTVLDIEDLSRMTTDASTMGSLWHGVRTVNVYLDSFFLSWSALHKNGQRTMSTIIPTQSVEKVNVHYFNPNKRKRKPQFSAESSQGKSIYDLDDATIQGLK